MNKQEAQDLINTPLGEILKAVALEGAMKNEKAWASMKEEFYLALGEYMDKGRMVIRDGVLDTFLRDTEEE